MEPETFCDDLETGLFGAEILERRMEPGVVITGAA
jgi:hypothetical protein